MAGNKTLWQFLMWASLDAAGFFRPVREEIEKSYVHPGRRLACAGVHSRGEYLILHDPFTGPGAKAIPTNPGTQPNPSFHQPDSVPNSKLMVETP